MKRPARILATLGLVWAVSARADEPPSRLRADSDMVCGPRCVQFVLKSYGREVGLIELVKEIQWPDLEAGASLDRIEQAFKTRGIHTRAVRLAPGRQLDWVYPSVLYTDEGNPSRGHYVVLFPGANQGDDPLIWDGVEGWRRGPWADAARGFSGVALLTAPDPIPESAVGFGPVSRQQWFQIVGLASIGVVFTSLLIRLVTKWRWSRSRLGASVSPYEAGSSRMGKSQ